MSRRLHSKASPAHYRKALDSSPIAHTFTFCIHDYFTRETLTTHCRAMPILMLPLQPSRMVLERESRSSAGHFVRVGNLHSETNRGGGGSSNNPRCLLNNTQEKHICYTTASLDAFTSKPMWVKVDPDTIKMPEFQLSSKCLTII